MSNRIDCESNHYCPVYRRAISGDLCYDSLMCLLGYFKIESIEELNEINNTQEARDTCKACPCSNLE